MITYLLDSGEELLAHRHFTEMSVLLNKADFEMAEEFSELQQRIKSLRVVH